MLPQSDPTKTKSWSLLKDHQHKFENTHLKDLFQEDSGRLEYLTFSHPHFYFDFSKNLVNRETIDLFGALAKECGLDEAKSAMKTGFKINKTEDRAVLHTALRNLDNKEKLVDEENVMPGVNQELSKIEEFTGKVHRHEIVGYTGKPITTFVNIGIGGSDLGPFMVVNALKPYWIEGVNCKFVSNIDASQLVEVLRQVDPETTMFIVASKTFTTQETMTNANSARAWFLSHAKDEAHIAKHFVAVSTNEEKVIEFGINPKNMFRFWDWVGGRYSLWSAIGLVIACCVGYDQFREILRGGQEMDKHFFSEPFESNIPSLMAFIGIWYNNFFGAETHAILPYDHLLAYLRPYLQQADMESNGKSVDRNGAPVNHQTGPIIWGEPGTNGQHAFYQLIHQGTKMIPTDFIAAAKPKHEYLDHHEKLLANFMAQTEALMNGKTEHEVVKEFKQQGVPESEYKTILPYKVFKGNNPSNSILMDELTPYNLGYLIALYEHKIFVQGVIWNIFSFDQWGVELGKQLAGKVLEEIKSGEIIHNHDLSTKTLLTKYQELKRR